MTDNQIMDYYVWPRHLYSHSRTCTCRGLCRIPSILVASYICYLLDRASVHEISTLVTWFEYMLDISSHYGSIIYLQPTWRSWSCVYLHHGDSELSILYVVMNTHAIFCIMPIHGHCTLMYPGLIYLLAVMCRVWSLYCTIGWLVLPLGSSSLHFWDGIIMYFGHRMTPLTSHIRANLLQLILPHMVDHTFMAFLVPLQTL